MSLIGWRLSDGVGGSSNAMELLQLTGWLACCLERSQRCAGEPNHGRTPGHRSSGLDGCSGTSGDGVERGNWSKGCVVEA